MTAMSDTARDLVQHPTLVVDYAAAEVRCVDAAGDILERHPFASAEAFTLVADASLRVGWDAKYVYSFTWMGRPIIQLPEDLMALQEAIHRARPDVIIEIGVAHGGSLVFHATLCRALGHGRVIGIDIEIRPHNRAAIERHPLFPAITLLEGDSIAPATLAALRELVGPDERACVILDGNHQGEHVAAELEAYAPFVGRDCYLIAMDGIMGRLAGAPRSRPEWRDSNPQRAVAEFLGRHPEFVLDPMTSAFCEGAIDRHPTYAPGGYVRRIA
jgi:cephalosporin hydroxylase